MKESIYTIPVNEIFEPKQGCPLCRMRDLLEERCIEYIMGAAMMEPDIRQETNAVGFCDWHLRQMLPRKNRLSIGLMFQSHLAYIRQEIAAAKAPAIGKDKRPELARRIGGGCYVCNRIDAAMDRMIDNTLKMWQREPSFRELFAGQEFVCFAHYARLFPLAQETLGKKLFPAFERDLNALTLKKLDALKADIDQFCNLFDYRAPTGPAPEQIRSSLERTAAYLTSRDPAQP